MSPDLLFYKKGSILEFLNKRRQALKEEVESYDYDYILKVSEEDLCQYLVDKYSLEVPIIYEDRITVYSPVEVDVDVSGDFSRVISDRRHPFYVKGVKIAIAIPFEGDEELFQFRPQLFTFDSPRGEIVGKEIHLIYTVVEHDEKKLKNSYQQDLNKIKDYLDRISKDVESFNTSLPTLVKELVSKRRNKLLDDLGLVSALGIPIRRRGNIPDTYTIPSVRKKIKLKPPEVSKEPFKPEPVLESKEYESILETIYDMSLVMERSPQTFSKLKEEEIRNHFLMMLNAIYEGQATGETFNFRGKTDILIRANGRNVFIAECKFWRGEKKLIETIDQLLSYTSWRDTKTAILLFNRNRNFSSVLKKIDPTVKSHRYYKREGHLESDKLKSETIFSYVFHQPEDKHRELILTIIAFDIPK